MLRVSSVVLGLVLALVLAQVGLAATIRVPEDFATIQEAVDAASDGDTILVGPGTYAGATVNKSLTIQSTDGPDATVIQGGLLFHGDSLSNIGVVGFTITGGPNCIDVTTNNLNGATISGNVITGCGNDGVHIFAPTFNDLNIENNNISNNGQDGVDLAGNGNVTVTGNKINNNGTTDDRGVGIRLGGGVSGVISGNELQGNAFAGIHPQ